MWRSNVARKACAAPIFPLPFGFFLHDCCANGAHAGGLFWSLPKAAPSVSVQNTGGQNATFCSLAIVFPLCYARMTRAEGLRALAPGLPPVLDFILTRFPVAGK